MRPYNRVTVSILNLSLLVETAASAGQPSSIEALFRFAHDHDVAYDKLIHRDTVQAALGGDSFTVLQHFVTAMPEAANCSIGHGGDALSEVLRRQRFDQASYLLDHGANPNSVCAGHKGPGYHLRLAARELPLEFTTLLLRHGAVVPRAGALQMAAEKGRLDVLEMLFDHGADLNERMELKLGFLHIRQGISKLLKRR